MLRASIRGAHVAASGVAALKRADKRKASFRARKESRFRMRFSVDRFGGASLTTVAWTAAGLPFRLHDIEEDHYYGINDYSVDHEKFRDALWEADNVDLVSVGIDIGSAGRPGGVSTLVC